MIFCFYFINHHWYTITILTEYISQAHVQEAWMPTTPITVAPVTFFQLMSAGIHYDQMKEENLNFVYRWFVLVRACKSRSLTTAIYYHNRYIEKQWQRKIFPMVITSELEHAHPIRMDRIVAQGENKNRIKMDSWVEDWMGNSGSWKEKILQVLKVYIYIYTASVCLRTFLTYWHLIILKLT